MPFSDSIIDREFAKFKQTNAGDTAVRTIIDQDSINGLKIPYHDEGTVTYPSANQEVYTFKLATVTVGVLTLNYTSSTKEFLLNWSLV